MQLMAVQLSFARTGFHMSKNMRYGSSPIVSILVTAFSLKVGLCSQVEFNKAAQSLTDAVISANQKKGALNRLIKVRTRGFFPDLSS